MKYYSRWTNRYIQKIPKCSGPGGFTVKFYQIFIKELKWIILKLLQKYRRRKNTSQLILLGQYYLDTKARQRLHTHTHKTTNTNIIYRYRCKYPQQNTSRLNLATYKKYYTPCPWEIYPRKAMVVQHTKLNQYNTVY